MHHSNAVGQELAQAQRRKDTENDRQTNTHE